MSLINAYFVFTIEVPDFDAVILNMAVGLPLTYPLNIISESSKGQATLLLKQTIGGTLVNIGFHDRDEIWNGLKTIDWQGGAEAAGQGTEAAGQGTEPQTA